MKKKKIIYGLVFLGLLFNCSSSGDDTPEPDSITYNGTVRNIVNSNCGNCHGNPTANGAPVSFTTYGQVSGSINSIISRINDSSNPMPPSGLMPQSLRDQIQQWKDGGLLEN